MSLELIDVVKRMGVETHIHPSSLVLEDASFNVLLGTTLAGKTTLMQLMAGIQQPTSGTIKFRGIDVTGVAVQKRNVSMVYQQFINYPTFDVYENIASPLRVAGVARAEIDKRVIAAAELLRLRPLLKRKPSELSGGQQQRTAIARAVVKDADLILLDEPLANLDYKLREELRDEFPKFFAGRQAIIVYATTEPSEALLFGGNTATLFEGRITQFGPTATTYRRPKDLVTAQVFSDPPINTARAKKNGKQLVLLDGKSWPVGEVGARLPDGDYIIGIRPHHISPREQAEVAGHLEGRVLIAELSGSESTIHLDVGGVTWVAQFLGVHRFTVGSTISLQVDINRILFFGANGELVS